MKINLPPQEDAKFAMAPMIDMVFLLLVFFMCASHLSQTQNVQLEIPTATKGVVPKERPDRWTVNIREDGTILSGHNEIELDDLAAAVKERMKENPRLKVYIRADAESPHKQVKDVMKELSAVGMDEYLFGVFVPSGSGGTP
ncbi:MAG: biopolymer transporter ExbD [Candidatus Pacebacteria bacterium]|nr:biopolymer transporter ExbD [Candidatus Paceibacterota bacterium]